jgi:hypothetical protein
LGTWPTKPVTAAATDNAEGQTFGKPGELIVLQIEKWPGQHFDLANHIDVGSQLTAGQAIVLLVHHDCDHCAAAVPKYVAAYGDPPASDPRPPTHDPRSAPRLAVIEMPPFADPTDPPLGNSPHPSSVAGSTKPETGSPPLRSPLKSKTAPSSPPRIPTPPKPPTPAPNY